MKIIDGITKVVKNMNEVFMTPILDGTGLIAVDIYDRKGHIVGSTLTKDQRTVMTTRIQI